MEYLPDWLAQVVLVVAVPLVVQLLKVLVQKFGWSELVQRWIVTGLAIVFSLVAGVLYFAPQFPAFAGDPVAWFIAAFGALAPFMAGVQIVYNFILKALFEKLGWV